MVKKVKEPTALRTRFSEIVEDKMDDLGLSINDVAGQVGSTYEHIRKIVRGSSPVVSKYLVKEICRVLKLDYEEMEPILNADKIHAKYKGKLPKELTDKNPELEPIERSWPKLTKAQKEDFIAQIAAVAKRNRTER